MEISEIIGACCAVALIVVGMICLTMYAIKVDSVDRYEKRLSEQHYRTELLTAIKSLKGNHDENI